MRGRAVMLVLCTLAAGPLARAQDGAERLAGLDRRAGDRLLSIREREGAADEAIEVRRRLIAGAPAGEARLAGWLVDQGVALLTRLGRDGSDSAVLFALPTPAQERAVAEAAAEAETLLGRAQSLLPAESRDEVATRAAFFRARALVLVASAGGGDRAALSARAHGLVSAMALSSPGPEALRRITVGAALLMRGGATGAEDARSALEEFAWVATGGRESGAIGGESPVPAPTRAEGWIGLLQAARRLGTLDQAITRLQESLGGATFSAGARPDPLLMVLAHDAMTRALFEAGLESPGAERGPMERALAIQEQLFARTDLGFDGATLRPIAAEKLALLASRAPGVALPAGFGLARAIVLARQPAGREEAVRLLSEIAGRPDAAGARADALWELAVLQTQPGAGPAARAEATGALLRLAGEFPSHARAAQAAVAAVAYARELAAEDGAGALYRRALILATDRYASLKDNPRWVYERVRLALESATDSAELSAALARLRAVAPGDPLGPDLLRIGDRAHAALMDQLWRRLAERRRAGGEEAARAYAAGTLEPEARAAAEWAAARGAPSRERFEADLALALTESGDAGGLPVLRRLAGGPGPVAHPGGAAHLKLGLARAVLLSGDTQAAFALLSEIATGLDAPAGAGQPARPETFWHAWTLMLEVLASQEGAGAQRGAIRAHITRLRSIDPALGGAPWKGRIEAVAAQLGAEP